MFTLYNVTSKDGFIARTDGREDFIPDNLWQNFLDICMEYGTLVMGRKTYDTMQGYSKKLLEPFEELPIKKIVVTGDREFKPKSEYIVTHSPQDAYDMEPNALVTSGPTLNNFILQNHLAVKIVYHEVPVAIGDGLEPFDKHLATLLAVERRQTLPGVTVREYKIL